MQTYLGSPLYRLHVVQKGPKATSAFKDHCPEAPVVHSYRVGFTLKQLWSLPPLKKDLQIEKAWLLTFIQNKCWLEKKSPLMRLFLTRYWRVPTKDVQRLPWSRSFAYPRSIILWTSWRKFIFWIKRNCKKIQSKFHINDVKQRILMDEFKIHLPINLLQDDVLWF